MRRRSPTQPELDLQPDHSNCEHRDTFYSLSEVPGGDYCCQCNQFISRSVPQSPAQLGWMSADWHWHYVEGRPWTHDLAEDSEGGSSRRAATTLDAAEASTPEPSTLNPQPSTA